MGVDFTAVPLLARRGLEAELAARLFAETSARVGGALAKAALDAAMDAAAREAGQAFAASAPGGVPCLRHFAQVLERWQAGGALTVEDIRLAQDALSFRVTRCGYMELYRELGIPQGLHASLSCRRDAAFAAGYSPQLRLERPQTISAGDPACLFRFRWEG